MYLKGLVNTGFKTVFTWVSCNGVTSRTYRRGMRGDVCSHAVGELFVQLYMEEVEVPPQPIARVDDDGCMLFPSEDEVRTELAKLSRDRNSMEVDGVLLASAVMSIASALGFTQDQLEAACAHELGTHGTRLLRRSSTVNRQREREAASRSLTRLLHNSPAPLPHSGFTSVNFPTTEGATDDHKRGNVSNTANPKTPDATPVKCHGAGGRMPMTRATKVKASGTGGVVKRGGTSEYTGVWFDHRVRKWCVKIIADPSTGKQVRLGAYMKEEDAAYAYAAGAFVIRQKDHFPKVMSLSDAEMAALEGAIVDDVRHLVQKRQWYRWREWRKAMDDIGVLPGTPFKPEPGAESPPPKAEAADSDIRDAEADEDLVSEDDNGEHDTSTPPPESRDDRDGESSSSRETTSNRRKAGTARSQEDARTARTGKRRRASGPEAQESNEEQPAPGPGPVSSNDDPNEALPRVNPRVDGDEEATEEEASDSAPVTRAEMIAIRKMQMDTAATMARLETALLASLANHQAKKRKRDNARGECDRVNPRKARRVASPEPSVDEDEVEDEEICEQLRVHLFIDAPDALMSFYPSSAAKSAGLCAVIERLTPTFASLTMAADKARRADLNRTLSDWKTAAAGRVRDIALPKLGLFRDERDARSPWAAPKARSAARVQERLLLTLDGEGKAVTRWLVTDAIRFWDTRKGKLSNSAGVNAQIVDGLRECALLDVMAAIEQYQPQYDPTTSSWAWGRHGLRLSACGVQRQESAGQAPSNPYGEELSTSDGYLLPLSLRRNDNSSSTTVATCSNSPLSAPPALTDPAYNHLIASVCSRWRRLARRQVSMLLVKKNRVVPLADLTAAIACFPHLSHVHLSDNSVETIDDAFLAHLAASCPKHVSLHVGKGMTKQWCRVGGEGFPVTAAGVDRFVRRCTQLHHLSLYCPHPYEYLPPSLANLAHLHTLGLTHIPKCEGVGWHVF
ncbi:unnamed protein product [Closterium sp. Naga37s-1]|nr:unnamed protein product [Closterium sp. Naga37s-1]